ncbi:hypothetical protein BD779DRAFT_1155972 [Infundibulicybe gibba]|nr:hypothetical protein BD779DRAFT_1155972 [Infundibulicybe gibba]
MCGYLRLLTQVFGWPILSATPESVRAPCVPGLRIIQRFFHPKYQHVRYIGSCTRVMTCSHTYRLTYLAHIIGLKENLGFVFGIPAIRTLNSTCVLHVLAQPDFKRHRPACDVVPNIHAPKNLSGMTCWQLRFSQSYIMSVPNRGWARPLGLELLSRHGQMKTYMISVGYCPP